MNEILKADFSNARVGDRVKCLFHGSGKIIEITRNYIYVKSKKCRDSILYDFNGVWIHGLENTLFYHFDTQFPTIEACTRPLPKIEVDEKVRCMIHGEWENRYFYEFEDGEMFVFENGRTSFSSNGSYVGCKYWKLASDETINSGNLHEIEGENE